MKRLDELTKYVLSIKYIEGAECADMEEINDGCEHPYSYLEYCDVEELVSELDDAFENCKMELESAKATIEELQEKLNRMKCDAGTVEPDELEGFGGHGQW